MTNKRFEVVNHYGVPKSVYDSEKDDVFGIGEVVRLLNTLHQENQSLKFQLDVCTKNKLFSRRKLEEENKQLRQENNFLKQIREAFQIDVKNSRQMLERWDKYE